MTRRFVLIVMTVLLLANLAAGPTVALAELLEHEQEQIQLDSGKLPAEPGTHCQHGCAGHYGQHFQSQVGVISIVSQLTIRETVPAATDYIPTQHFSALPFRPPLTGAILS